MNLRARTRIVLSSKSAKKIGREAIELKGRKGLEEFRRYKDTEIVNLHIQASKLKKESNEKLLKKGIEELTIPGENKKIFGFFASTIVGIAGLCYLGYDLIKSFANEESLSRTEGLISIGVVAVIGITVYIKNKIRNALQTEYDFQMSREVLELFKKDSDQPKE